MPPAEYIFKAILLGDCAVGKTSILRNLGNHPFIPETMHTIGIDFTIRRFILDGCNIKLQLWDTSGQERFRTITRSYYRGCSAVFLLFSMNNRNSFNSLNGWYQEILEYAKEESFPIFYVIGSKADMEREVSTEEAMNYANEINAIYTETSAKHGIGISELFDTCSRQLLENVRKKHSSIAGSGTFKLGADTNRPKSRWCGSCSGRFVGTAS
jgi:small GTP-binding protein